MRNHSAPIHADTNLRIAALERDNFPPDPRKWSILLSPTTVLLSSPSGRKAVEIPRKQFNVIARWYVTGFAGVANRPKTYAKRKTQEKQQ